MTTLLLSERIRIRPIETEEDLKYLFRSFNDPESFGQFVNFDPRSWDEFQSHIREGAKSPAQFTPMLIEKNDEKRVIGSVVHFVPHPLGKACLEIGYGIDDLSLRRKGFGTEAANLFVDFLFKTKPLERIQAMTNIANRGSQRVLEKVGFKQEGTLRHADFLDGQFSDMLIYSILKEDWKKRKATPENSLDKPARVQ